jgi:hypothetical protein
VNAPVPHPRVGVAAPAGLLAIARGGAGLAGCANASSASARSRERPTVVADSGFRPPSSGYSFANYGTEPGVPNLGGDEMRQLFGDGVCAGFSGGVCVLSPPALAWMLQENAAMAAGHCFGLSVTALFFFSHLSSPGWFGAGAVSRLRILDNQLLARAIAYAYAFQALDSIRRAQVSTSPREVLARLTSALRTGRDLYTLAITHSDGSGGHAVTPYEIERLRPNHYAILVYDNNYPRSTRKVQVNTQTDSWSYNAAPIASQPGGSYTGTATTRSLFLLPTRPGLGVQPCPFCSATPAPVTPATATEARARPKAVHYETVRLQSNGRVGAHLQIIDRRGRRIGFVHGRLVNRIPGARIISLFVGSTRTWLNHTEPAYELPTGQRFRIELTGDPTTGAHRGRAERSRGSVTVLEPGFVAAVRRVAIYPGQQDQVNLSAGGHAISFISGSANRQAPELVLGNAAPGTNDHEWNITSRGTPAGGQITASMDVPGHRMSLVGAGGYDLSMDMVGNSVSVFAHRDFGLGTGVTAEFDYGHWSAGDPMPVTLIKHGKVFARERLRDQPNSSDTGGEFDPVEPTPAPPEPQPHPVSPGTTGTTLVCSPGTTAVGSTAACKVDVSGLDSAAPSTPAGVVRFASDGNGSFFPSSCTLSAGACEVTYTPAVVGSGTHRLTASYAGDGAHQPSGDTIALNVTPRLGAAPQSSTSTSLQCQPPVVPVGAATTCRVTVTDTGSAVPSMPTGGVNFASDGNGSFFPSSCTLSAGACEVTYTPAVVGSGTHRLTASYAGDGAHQPSGDTIALQVNPPVVVGPSTSTGTSLQCQPLVVPVGAATTCRVTVTDTGSAVPSMPTGGVNFASDGNGSFFPSSCTLSAGACEVTYTPAVVGSGTHHLTASYTGDGAHQVSSATTAVHVGHRDTATALQCVPAAVQVGQGTTCTAVVSDTDFGTTNTPTGKVTFSSDGPGTFQRNPCILVALSNSSAHCSLTYTPTSDQSRSTTITATYNGSSRDEPSAPVVFKLTVRPL